MTTDRAPIFLICSERSGSNLISAMMGAHPLVYAHPPYHLGRDLLLNLSRCMASGPKGTAWEALIAHAVDKVASYRSPEEAAKLKVWLSSQETIDPAAIARFIWQQMPEGAEGKHVFVKENNIHHLIAFLVTAFPDAKFVYQVRDPRDFLASAKARRKQWMGNKFGSLRRALTVWREDQEGGLTALALLGPERVCLLRYEDLVADARTQLERICRFVGLDFDPSMLSFHEGAEAKKVASTTGARENVAKPLMTSNFRKYRAQLSRGEIRITEAWLGDIMMQLGYPCDFSRKEGRPSIWLSLRPQISEFWERLSNGEVYPFYKHGHRKLTRALDSEIVPMLPPIPDKSDRSK
ncbi:sulfotransferase family protein [Thioclava sp. FR2]|uniref:sulfotransferase family protein n=1 Tax=Thioclava sp. FR2 TaxID=3445780 RepID=UPI003EBA21D0